MRNWFVSTILVVAAVSLVRAQAFTLIFPQIADGGGIRSELLLTNPTSQTDTGSILFTGTDGLPLTISIGGKPGSILPYALPPGGVLQVRTDGTGTPRSGYAIVSSSRGATQLTGSLVYSVGGSEVSVPCAALDTAFHVFVQKDAASRTGLAIVNVGGSPLRVSAILLDQSGTRQASTTIDLAPECQTAKFLDEIFTLGATFTGSVHLTAGGNPFAAVGLRQRSSGALATLGGAASAFPADIAVTTTDHPAYGLVAVHANGERLVAFTQKDAAGHITKVTGGVWTAASGKAVTVYRGSDGLPNKMVADGHIFLFGNYTTNSVDIAIIPPSGETRIVRNVAVDSTKLAALKGFGASSATSVAAFATPSGLLGDIGEFFAEASLAFDIATCVGAGALTIAGMGGPAPLLIAGCSGLVFRGIDYLADTYMGGDVPNLLGTTFNVVGCVAKQASSCVSLILDATAYVCTTADDLLSAKQGAIDAASNELTGGSSALLKETFDSGGVPQGWIPERPIWKVENGVLVQSQYLPNTRYQIRYQPGLTWQNYRFSIDAWSDGWYFPSAITLMFRYKDFANTYVLVLHADGSASLYRRVAGEETLLGKVTLGSQVQQKARYTIEAKGTSLRVLRNGTPILSVTDAGITSGTIAFESVHIPGFFDNVEVAPAN
ncbi:MAG: hypothetical protein EHM23_26555 [Acidobacteria bacterium]|nr:MAG: hypothetical protein EHM23_26555 [Acidobacteriota bacterium]